MFPACVLNRAKLVPCRCAVLHSGSPVGRGARMAALGSDWGMPSGLWPPVIRRVSRPCVAPHEWRWGKRGRVRPTRRALPQHEPQRSALEGDVLERERERERGGERLEGGRIGFFALFASLCVSLHRRTCCLRRACALFCVCMSLIEWHIGAKAVLGEEEGEALRLIRLAPTLFCELCVSALDVQHCR